MPTIVVPPLMRDLTAGEARVRVPGRTVREAIDGLAERYPGVRSRLCAGTRLAPDLAVVVDGHLSRMGLLHPLEAQSEVRFIPAIEGG